MNTVFFKYKTNNGTVQTSDSQRKYMGNMRGSRKLCQRGTNFDNIFLAYEWRDDSSATFKWRFAGVPIQCNGPTLKAGLVAL